MQEAQRLRARIAKTLGYKNFAAEAIETKMAKTPEAVFKFLDDLKDKVRSAYGRHRRKLSCAKQFASGGKTGKDTCKLNSWDHSFYGQVITREDFKYDPQEVREYFPVDVVVAGVLEVYQKVLGLRFAEQKAPPSTKMWHPDLRWFNVTDASKSGEDYAKTSGAFVGEFVLDIFPRAGKYGHAMAATMQPGYVLPSGAQQHPISAMVANLDPKRPGKPSLLSHGEVTTFFHEFGHVMHNLCSKTAFSSFSGTAVERDFVEAPSQMLEFWTWSPTVLRMISNKNPGGGGAPETFPEELLAKIKRARDSSEAAGDNGQLVLAYFDMLIHTDEHADVQATWAKVERDLGLSAVIKGTNRAASFGHMFGGYNAGYYGYLWSKVYAADMFSLFQAGEGLLDEALGHRYRNRILAPGGSRDAIDSLKDFLGREPNNHAFIKALGIEPNTPEFAAVEAMEKESTVMKGCTCGKEWETAIEDEGVVAEVAVDASGAVETFGANLKPVAAIANHLDSVVAELDTALGKIARKKMARVIEDYVALAGDQLSLSKGDVLEDVDVHTSQKGWYSGHKVGTAVPGIFPARMVEMIKTEKEAAVAAAAAATTSSGEGAAEGGNGGGAEAEGPTEGANAKSAVAVGATGGRGATGGAAAKKAQATNLLSHTVESTVASAKRTADLAQKRANEALHKRATAYADKSADEEMHRVTGAASLALRSVGTAHRKGIKGAAQGHGDALTAMLAAVNVEATKAQTTAKEADELIKQTAAEIQEKINRRPLKESPQKTLAPSMLRR